MRVFINIVIFICVFTEVNAQINIVRNPSFEQHNGCPLGPDNIRMAYYWSPIDTVTMLPICSAEYCHICSNVFGVPYGWGAGPYFQYARSGGGMVLSEMYVNSNTPFISYSRDYIQGKFYKVLTAGKSYCVTFYVSLSEGSGYAINQIGAYIDNGGIDLGQDSVGCAMPQTLYSPQILTTSIINDTLNWVKIQGNFTATGSEKFVTIGNFSDVYHTDTLHLQPIAESDYSWYLIDDVSVIESTAKADAGQAQVIEQGDSVHIGTNEEGMPCTWYVAGSSTPIGYSGGIWVKPDTTTTYVVELDLCGNVTRDSVRVWVWPLGMKPVTPKGEPLIWPNPASNELHVDNGAGGVLSVYDVVGREVFRKIISIDNEVINIGTLQKGLYLIHVVEPSTGQRFVKRIVKE